MSEAHRRPKQPQLIRDRLIAATIDLLVEEGIGAVTLNAVAARAGVSKGGLQHHFSSKQELLQALSSEVLDHFKRQVETVAASDTEPHGRHTRAYLRASADGFVEAGERELWKAAMMLVMARPEFRMPYQAWEAASLQHDAAGCDDATRLLLCRLAADGLWLADLLGHRSIDPTQRAALVRQLEQMTRPRPATEQA
ncbi:MULTISPECIES: TetR/AcrR family transcriptional regulator [Cupriavidus]|uniref:TetR/AcrR family transcriptional regulator n=1 Tax=Cupriavidus pauculus TaxID=82633 RepID=A0A3G8H5D4_9BURK|nr:MULTISPECIES: TetR/AcrR family transcriptional regulator [Cupriavidus]AZG15485.1 TetR/AcrR family transcriptional regulator [Cupriavidus pauculus]MDT6961892.1 TetR/AcrR family transcriptional regulator [Cupriavidus sp. SZY C1]